MASKQQLEEELHRLLKEEVEYREFNKYLYFKPYPKQIEFYNISATKRESLFISCNQGGKTYGASFPVAYHLTGLYPKWWKGRKFDGPTRWWVAAEDGPTTRDGVQKYLFGEMNKLGSGSIPKSHIDESQIRLARSTPNLIDFAAVKHVSGGYSHIAFKSYGKGRERFQSETLHGVWLDEEPDIEAYTEFLTRTNVHQGLVICTFTPLLGMSDVVLRFLKTDGDEGAKQRGYVQMGIMDIPDSPWGPYTAEQKKAIIHSYPEHERDARANGVPMLGSGKVFQVPEVTIRTEPFELPSHWKRGFGMDFGWGDHPTAGAACAHDPDTDTFYVYDVYRSSESGIAYHASAIKKKAGKIPVFWPHDGMTAARGKDDGRAVKDLYRDEGLRMFHEHSTHTEGGFGLEASIAEMDDRMKTGRFKVFSACSDFFEEYRTYHRDNGVIVKKRDDVISAVRMALMMVRHFMRPSETERKSGGQETASSDYNVFGYRNKQNETENRFSEFFQNAGMTRAH